MRAGFACLLLSTSAAACHLVLPHHPGSSPTPDGGSSGHDLRLEGPVGDGARDLPRTCSRRSLTIETKGDDGEIEGQTGNLTSAGEAPLPPEVHGIYIGFWNNGPSWGYFRFRLPEAIPPDAVVTSATLLLRGLYRTTQWNPSIDALQVSLEASADAPIVDDPMAAPHLSVGRSLVSSKGVSVVRWPPQGGLDWKVDGDNRTPELAPLVGALLAAKGPFPAGAHVQLWLRGERTSGAAEVTTTVFENDNGSRPLARLDLEWCQP